MVLTRLLPWAREFLLLLQPARTRSMMLLVRLLGAVPCRGRTLSHCGMSVAFLLQLQLCRTLRTTIPGPTRSNVLRRRRDSLMAQPSTVKLTHQRPRAARRARTAKPGRSVRPCVCMCVRVSACERSMGRVASALLQLACPPERCSKETSLFSPGVIRATMQPQCYFWLSLPSLLAQVQLRAHRQHQDTRGAVVRATMYARTIQRGAGDGTRRLARPHDSCLRLVFFVGRISFFSFCCQPARMQGAVWLVPLIQAESEAAALWYSHDSGWPAAAAAAAVPHHPHTDSGADGATMG